MRYRVLTIRAGGRSRFYVVDERSREIVESFGRLPDAALSAAALNMIEAAATGRRRRRRQKGGGR